MKNILFPLFISATIVILLFVLFPGLEGYFTTLLGRLTNNPGSYAVTSYFVLASDILLPIPSSIVMYVNGHVLGVIGGTAISLMSLLTTAVVGYFLGLYTSFGFKAQASPGAGSIIKKYGSLAILVTRGIPVLSESVCIVCGYNKMLFAYYFLLNLAGYIPICLLYAFFGSFAYDTNAFLLSFGCSLLLSAAFWIFGRRLILR